MQNLKTIPAPVIADDLGCRIDVGGLGACDRR
jgi:hypothetical protein